MSKRSKTVAGQQFKNKAAFIAFYKQTIAGIGVGVDVTESHTDFAFLLGALQTHSESETKVGVGIRRFFFSVPPLAKGKPHTLQMNFERIDGSIEHASYQSFFRRPKTDREKLIDAMRVAVAPQIACFRSILGRCAICGKPKRSSFEVDHWSPTFKELVDAFLAGKENVPTTFDDDAKTNRAVFRESDDRFSEAWEDYHAANAKLRLLCVRCHLTVTKEG